MDEEPLITDTRFAGSLAMPDLVGQSWADALTTCMRFGLNLSTDDAGEALMERTRNLYVSGQQPAPGAPVRFRDSTRVSLSRVPPASGVREPRRPHPPLGSASLAEHSSNDD